MSFLRKTPWILGIAVALFAATSFSDSSERSWKPIKVGSGMTRGTYYVPMLDDMDLRLVSDLLFVNQSDMFDKEQLPLKYFGINGQEVTVDQLKQWAPSKVENENWGWRVSRAQTGKSLQIEVFDLITNSLQKRLTVPALQKKGVPPTAKFPMEHGGNDADAVLVSRDKSQITLRVSKIGVFATWNWKTGKFLSSHRMSEERDYFLNSGIPLSFDRKNYLLVKEESATWQRLSDGKVTENLDLPFSLHSHSPLLLSKGRFLIGAQKYFRANDTPNNEGQSVETSLFVVYDLSEKRILWNVTQDLPLTRSGSSSFSPSLILLNEEKELGIVHKDGIEIRDITSGRLLRTLPLAAKTVDFMASSPDGNWLWSASLTSHTTFDVFRQRTR